MELKKLVRDKTKRDAYMCVTLLNMFQRGELRKDHPLQRKSGRWQPVARDGFVATAIKHEDVDSVKICEQIIGDNVVLWLIDGIQRLTTLENYRNGVFKIGQKVEEPVVYYQVACTDDDGNVIKDKNNNIEYRLENFDLRGKAYKDLPIQLKEQFDNFPIDVVKHLDCDDKQVGYHIRRYNRQTSMNATESAVTYMDNVARFVKEVADNNRFFKDCGAYRSCERTNGTIYRIVAESVMVMRYFDNWNKDSKLNGSYLSNHATENDFHVLDENLNRLQEIVPESCYELFNAKNSFIWFGLFEKFKNLDLPDSRFADFLVEFVERLCFESLKIADNKPWTEVDAGKGTKDKRVIQQKMEILEYLMREFLEIDESIKEYNTDALIEEFFGTEFSGEDIDQFEEIFDELTLNVDNGSRLMDEKNRPSFITLIAYSFKNDMDLDEWLVDYFKNNSTYFVNQKKNYLHMKKDLDEYYHRLEKKAV